MPTPEERIRMTDAAIKLVTADKGPRPPTPQEQLVAQARATTDEVRRLIAPVLGAVGTQYDPNATRLLVGRLYTERFNHYSKDELVFLCSLLHTEIMMDTI